MFQESVRGGDPASWRAAGGPWWRLALPALLRPATVVALREDVVAAARRAEVEAFTFLHGPDARPAPVVCWSVDRHADRLNDVARERALLAIAHVLLGRAAVPLRGDYLLLPPSTQPTMWRQAHADHVAHFADEPAALIWLPLRHEDAAWGQIEFSAFPGRTLVPADEVEHPRLARRLVEQERGPREPCPVPTGGCVAFDSHAVWRFGTNAGTSLVEGVLLHYRRRPFDEA